MQNIVGLDNGLAPDQRQAITQRNCVIYTFSGYKYTLISEWIKLFGLLRILDNLIAGAVCYFCTTISVFCEIYTLRMRVVAHAAIVWVGWFFMPSSGVGLGNGPHQNSSSFWTLCPIGTHVTGEIPIFGIDVFRGVFGDKFKVTDLIKKTINLRISLAWYHIYKYSYIRLIHKLKLVIILVYIAVLTYI